MKLTSLRLRLLLAAAISIAFAVGITGVVLVYLFKQYIESRVYTELESHLQQLTEGFSVAPDGKIKVVPLADQRFEQPFSGLYWQVTLNNAPPKLSRSLWDEGLVADYGSGNPGEMKRHTSTGPAGSELLVLEWSIKINPSGKEQTVNLSIAADRKEIAQATASFTRDLAIWLALLAVALLLAASIQVGVGLRPLEVLRGRVAQIKSGTTPRLAGDYPSEVAPLVDELNDLLAVRDTSLTRARARAGDLAHGLKTPLTVLSAVAREMRQDGGEQTAVEIDEQVATMGRHIERELMRARLGTRSNARTDVGKAAGKMIAAMVKLPGGDELSWQLAVPEGLAAPIDAQDLAEILGNLLDNARIWAKSKVRISASASSTGCSLYIDDDGPGVPEDKISVILQRGRRLDETKKGSGLGLAIARDIAMAYGGDLNLHSSTLGGLQAEVVLPTGPSA